MYTHEDFYRVLNGCDTNCDDQRVVFNELYDERADVHLANEFPTKSGDYWCVVSDDDEYDIGLFQMHFDTETQTWEWFCGMDVVGWTSFNADIVD